MARFRWILASLALLVAPATLVAADVTAVMSGPAPRDGVQELELEEVWRRGGEDDEEVLLGIITGVLSGPDGNLYVLDSQIMDVKVFDADGELVTTLGRQGQGPGEFSSASGMAFLTDTEIGVLQGMPGKVIGLNFDGTPGRVVSIGGDPSAGGFAVAQRAASGGGNLVVAGLDFKMTADNDPLKRHVTAFLRAYDLDGVQTAEYFAREENHVFGEGYVLDEERWDSPARRYAVSGQGQLVMAEQRNEYRFAVYGADGTKELEFGREFEPWPRTEDMRQRYDRMLEIQARQMSPDAARSLADTEPDVWGIHCHADGSYWVLNARGLFDPPAGTFVMWDVFSAEGEFVKQVTAAIPGTSGEDLLFLTDHDLAVQVTGFWDAVLSAMGAASDDAEGEPMEIICYRIK